MSARSPKRSPILDLVRNSSPRKGFASAGESHATASAHSPANNGPDASDAHSQSSSVEYDHETFDTFQLKVEELGKQLWPKAARIEIEKLKGGSFNRIIGITVRPASHIKLSAFSRFLSSIKAFLRRCFRLKTRSKILRPATAVTMRYILRLPRDFCIQMEYESAFLQFVGSTTSIPVPRVIAIDMTDNNVLGEPFIIQERVPGSSLAYIYKDLHPEQKVSIAKQLGNIWLEMQKKSYDQAGEISPDNVKDILQFTVHDRYLEPDLPREPIAEEYNASYWLYDMGKRRRVLNPDDWDIPWTKFSKMADAIDDETGLFRDHDGFTISHGDLEARNILVEIIDSQNVRITGIVDWDSACIGPRVLACTPPSWLWRWNEYFNDELEDTIEANARLVPGDHDMRLIKSAFEETVGPDFMELGYTEESHLMRKLIQYAMYGLQNQTTARKAVQLLYDWHKKRDTVDEDLIELTKFWAKVSGEPFEPAADETTDAQDPEHSGSQRIETGQKKTVVPRAVDGNEEQSAIKSQDPIS